MKNTGITCTSTERSPVILPEMAELLPPLSAEQSAALEEDLLRNGCYAPIIVNEDMVIVDGHTIVWNYVGELIFNMLVLVGAIKMSDRIIRELMGLG